MPFFKKKHPQKKKRYKVTCHLELSTNNVQTFEIATYAYSRRLAKKHIQETVKFKVIKANQMKFNPKKR